MDSWKLLLSYRLLLNKLGSRYRYLLLIRIKGHDFLQEKKKEKFCLGIKPTLILKQCIYIHVGNIILNQPQME